MDGPVTPCPDTVTETFPELKWHARSCAGALASVTQTLKVGFMEQTSHERTILVEIMLVFFENHGSYSYFYHQLVSDTLLLWHRSGSSPSPSHHPNTTGEMITYFLFKSACYRLLVKRLFLLYEGFKWPDF